MLIPLSVLGADYGVVFQTCDDFLKNDEFLEEEKVEHLDSVVLSVSRAGHATPMTFTTISKSELSTSNPSSSLPMVLGLQPSVVSFNEGGTGLGYSKLTIRGSQGSQINITLNGVRLNDAESQEVFWVNMPALTNVLSSVQVQRGLGTTTNGAGAFGASINMSSAFQRSEPYFHFNSSVGSYNTFITTMAVGTGLLSHGLYFDAAYSRAYTDGYIRNARAKLQSIFMVLGWKNASKSLKFTYLMGDQHTGITWHGISMEQYKKDRRYNKAGLYHDEYGNEHYYDNDTDNYIQHHLQVNYIHEFSRKLAWNTTLNYTRGDGYYENYWENKSFENYGFDNLQVGGDTYFSDYKSDFVVREGMANDYFVLNSDLKYRSSALNFISGFSLSHYNGDHIGSVVWNEILGKDFNYNNHSWYFNQGVKQEANFYMRTEYSPFKCFTSYIDLQYRGVSLLMNGNEDDGVSLDYNKNWSFFNPRLGMSFNWSSKHKAYVSGALGHREPSRSDIKNTILTRNMALEAGLGDIGVGLKPEKMMDIELGYVFRSMKTSASVNLYFMEYWDMLLETGKLSSVGYPIKENVGRGYRRGVEVSGLWKPYDWVTLEANTTLSINEILNYRAYCELYDNVDNRNYLGMKEYFFEKTTMLMSPSVIAMGQVTFQPFVSCAKNSLKTTTLVLNGKYVGCQFWDNTSSLSRSVPAYFVMNLSLNHEFNLNPNWGLHNSRLKGRAHYLGLGLYLNNLLNNKYYADAWVYRAYFQDSATEYIAEGIYPQAPFNLMLKLTYRF